MPPLSLFWLCLFWLWQNLSGAPEWGPTQHFGFAKILPHWLLGKISFGDVMLCITPKKHHTQSAFWLCQNLSGASEWGPCPTQHFGFAKILPHWLLGKISFGDVMLCITPKKHHTHWLLGKISFGDVMLCITPKKHHTKSAFWLCLFWGLCPQNQSKWGLLSKF
jgi:predicted thioredoxin/glutaredoxin